MNISEQLLQIVTQTAALRTDMSVMNATVHFIVIDLLVPKVGSA